MVVLKHNMVDQVEPIETKPSRAFPGSTDGYPMRFQPEVICFEIKTGRVTWYLKVRGVSLFE